MLRPSLSAASLGHSISGSDRGSFRPGIGLRSDILPRQNPDADLRGCYAYDKGENDRSLITSDAKTRPLNQASAVRAWCESEYQLIHVIAAVLLLHERSVDEIVTKLRPGELEQVIKLVGRNPGCYPPGTLDALKGRRNVLPPAPPMASVPNSGSA